MTDTPLDLSNLDDAIVELYRAALDDFVRRRDALAKELRAQKRRDDADRVKALRKPNRTAWALNAVLVDKPEVIEELVAAVQAAQEPQARGGPQLRTALDNVRSAVREVAHAGARASIRGGQPVDATALVGALNAVIGDANAFAELQTGRLSEIPEAGGLDFLAVASVSEAAAPELVDDTQPSPEEPRETKALAAARAKLQRAEELLREARVRAESADEALATAREHLAASQKAFDRAQQDAEDARSKLREAERQVGELK